MAKRGSGKPTCGPNRKFTHEGLALVPAPQKMELLDGVYTFSKGAGATNLVAWAIDQSLPREGYRLRIGADGISIAAADADGEFHARQTLRQIADRSADGRLPFLSIEDWPDYEWRGLLFDDCRHFFGKQTVKRVLDLMARYKLNRFDWHLTENEAFRLEVPGYPDLVKYAAVRSKSIARDHTTYLPPYKYDDMKYGPFYYAESELKELVAYAAERHVTIVPGIDFPAHCGALLAAYPEFCCNPECCASREPVLTWIGGNGRTFCVGNPKAVKFVDDLIDYVCCVFPGKYINVNADECPFEPWLTCPKCTAFMKENGFKHPSELYGWLVKRMFAQVEGHGKVALAYDETLGIDGVGRNFIPISWRMKDGDGGGHKFVSYTEAVATGYDVLVQPHMWTYFCYGQGLENDPCSYGNPNRMSGGGNLTLHRCYLFNPRYGVPAESRRHVLGSEFSNWSEMTLTEPELMWKMWPRGCAMAEVLWTGSNRPGFADFKRRMKQERMYLIRHGFNCALLEDPAEPFETTDGDVTATPESQGVYSKDILEWLGDVSRQFGRLAGYAIRRHGKVIAQGGVVGNWTKVYNLREYDVEVCVAFHADAVHGSVERLDELVGEWIVPTIHPSPRAEDPVSNGRLKKYGMELGRWCVKQSSAELTE